MSDEGYVVLRRKVDGFFERTQSNADGALRCGDGCSACCEVDLTLSPVEAHHVRDFLLNATALTTELATTDASEVHKNKRCVALGNDGSCRIYPVRPLVCRSQGLALLYPAGALPQEAVFAESASGDEVTWCPLNYTERSPTADEILNAGTVDAAHASLNQSWCDGIGTHALERTPLRQLVREIAAKETAEPANNS